LRSRGNVVGIANMLRDGRSGVRIPEGHTSTPALRPTQPPIQWVLSRRKSDRGVKLVTHLHLVQRLRMSGAVPLFLLYAFMAWTRKLLYFASISILPTPPPLHQQSKPN
jgi:hypothetical protein